MSKSIEAPDADAGREQAGFFSRHPVGFWFFFWGNSPSEARITG